MSNWLEERIHRLELSIGRLRDTAGLLRTGVLVRPLERTVIEPINTDDELISVHWLLRKESSICLRRAIVLWWGLRWGRK